MTDFFLRFLYKTVPGRVLLKVLVSPGVSRVAGRFLSSNISRLIVPWYIQKHKVSMDDINIPPGGFSSFNNFFIRKRMTPPILTDEENPFISPCDGLLTVVPIQEDSKLLIKGTLYSLSQLLDDQKLAQDMTKGLALIFRLTPRHYHRYCYSIDGKVLSSRKIKGILHCVRPVAVETFPVFVQNSREYQVIQIEERTLTEGSHQDAKMVQMEIGALLVGKIINRPLPKGSGKVHAGEEKGYFEFGGSTIVLLFEKDMIRLDSELFYDRDRKGEVPVYFGQSLGKLLL